MNKNYTRMNKMSGILMFLFMLQMPVIGNSQTEPEQENDSYISRTVKLSGDFGAYSELYSISGREQRRPSSTERLFFNPSISFYNSLKLDFHFVLSSEGNSSRQDINQLDINPIWSWGNIHAGDFSLGYSPLTVSGIKIRGGAVELTPGKLHFATFGGTSQREVVTLNQQQSYKREIYGGLIGYGQDHTSHIRLTVLKAEDIYNEVEDITTDTTGMTDTLIDTTYIEDVTPKENLVAALQARLDLFESKFSLSSEFSGSAYTRDLTASDLNPDEIPSGVDDVISLKTSSSVDYASVTDLKMTFKKVTVTGKYTYIGPGYISLGVASLQNDVKSIGTGFSLRQRKFMLRVNTVFQTDNLIGQKQYTTNRNRFNFNFNYRASQKWNINNSVNFSTMKNDATSDNLLLDYSTIVLRTGHKISLSKTTFRSLSLDYTYQKSKDANPLRSSSKLDSHSASFGLQIMPSRNLSLSPMLKVLMNKQGESERRTTNTYSLAARHFGANKKLVTSAQVSLSNQKESDNLRGSIRSRYTFENFGSFGVEISHNKYSTDILNQSSFDESFVKFNYSKSF